MQLHWLWWEFSLLTQRSDMTQRKAGTCPGSWWRVSDRVPSTWVIYLAESSTPLSAHGFIYNASCLLPFTHSRFVPNLNWVILTFILDSDSCVCVCVCVSQPNQLSPSLFPFSIVLYHPGFVSVAQPFRPVSVSSMDLEHIYLIIHSPPSTYAA